jgi:hypothetical protein
VTMSGPCTCPNRDAWRVTVRCGNRSAFNGYRWTDSDYSEVICDVAVGGCGARWRTRAWYVDGLPDHPDFDRMTARVVRAGGKGERVVVAPVLASYGRPSGVPLCCDRCGRPGGPLLGPLSPDGTGRVTHRDGCHLADTRR